MNITTILYRAAVTIAAVAGVTLGGAGLASAVTQPAPAHSAHRITEDDPRWDCRTMGNHVCGAASWKAQTCTAFRAWEHRPAAGSLATLVTDSAHLGRGWLKADVLELAATASSPSSKAAKYLGDDATYVNQDCGG